jgi:type I restriction enzyme S subunit
MNKKLWQRVPIVNLCETHVDCVNRTAPLADGPTEFKMIRTTNVRDGFIDVENVRYVDEPTFHRWTRRLLPRKYDVILTREAPLGEVGMLRSNDRIFLGQRLYHFRADPEKLDPHFLLYSLLGEDLQGQIRGFGSGATVEHMRLGDIPELYINAPPIETQRKIAGILSAYDDLIENNLRRIKILEEMAQSLYREWFVQFRFPGHESAKFTDSSLGRIPKGWEVKPLFDVATVKYGKMLPKKDLAEDGPFPVYGAAKVIGRHTSYTREDRTIICGCRGSVGEMQITEPWCYVTNNSFTFDPVSANIYFWLFYTLSERGLRDVTGGAAQPQITLDGISQVFLSVPSDSILGVFEKRSRALAELAWNLKSKNQNLRRTRDLLLPKLLTSPH